MSTILNILGKIPEYIKYSTVTPEQHAAGELANPSTRPVAKKAAKQDAPKPPDPEANWKQELFELGQRLRSMPSTDQAEQQLAAVEAEVAEKAIALESEIKAAYDSSTTPFLLGWEKAEIDRKIARLSERLSDLHANYRCKLAQAKALVEACKTWNPLRPRWEELKRRQAAIDSATAGEGRARTFKPQPIVDNRLTF